MAILSTARTHCTAQGLEILADTKRSALAELAGLQYENIVELPCPYTLKYRKDWAMGAPDRSGAPHASPQTGGVK